LLALDHLGRLGVAHVLFLLTAALHRPRLPSRQSCQKLSFRPTKEGEFDGRELDIVSTAKGFGCAAVGARTKQEISPALVNLHTGAGVGNGMCSILTEFCAARGRATFSDFETFDVF
jgi:hypothetical protein